MSTLRQIRDALETGQRTLVASAEPMTENQLVGASYCKDWNIAQVLSHLGSASESFRLYLDAGLANADPPGREVIEPIWDRWNAMAPEEQRGQALAATAAFIEHVDAVPAGQLAAFQMQLFGMDVDAARLLGMRLAESAVHTWDIVVMSDPSAMLPADAVDDMIDHLGDLAKWSGKADGGPMEVEIVTTDPIRFFRLSVKDGVSLLPSTSDHATATLHLPSEALVRLAYGRLDPEHTPASVEAEGIDLDAVRAVFPGF
ncbi:MAG TPA: maleylpyruvate isomerase family mycothiol-dependent enzyme [Candidatus Dormibacteraeota bacterium]